MAHACLAITYIPDSLPCNPAMLPAVPKPKIGVQALLSNGYSTIDRLRKLLGGNIDQDTIDGLFSGDRVLQVEGNGELDFVSKYFAARYTPITIKYFSVIRNEANPDVNLSAVEEHNFMAQFAYPVFSNLSIGVEIKNYQRRYVQQDFLLADLATDAGKEALKPKTQNGTLFAPAAVLFLPIEYKPRIALKVVNLGSTVSSDETLREPVEVEGGLGATIPIGWTSLDVDLDYRSLSYYESASERFHLGGVLRFGAMSVMGGADDFGFSGGVFYAVEAVNAGILFSTTQAPWNSNDYYANTVYLQIGWQI